MGNSRGGITVFLAVIFMAMLVFTGSLVDVARIMVAQRKVEASLSTSARSVLAGYDTDLAGEFGLFGLDSRSGMEAELQHYLVLNLVERHKGISFIDYEKQSDNINAEGSLLSKEIIKRQILEYMKYRAPLSISANLIEQIKKAKLGQKTEFAGKERGTRDKAKELEHRIEALNKEIENINDVLKDLDEKELEELQDSLGKVLNEYIPEIQELYQAYMDARKESEEFLDQRDPEDNISNRESGINGNGSREFEPVLGDCGSIRDDAARLKKKVDVAVRKVVPLRKQVEEMQSRIKSLKHTVDSMEKQGNPPADTIARYEKQIRELQREVEGKESQIADIMIELQDEVQGEALKEIELYEDEEDLPEHEGEDNKDEFLSKLDEINSALEELSANIGQEALITQEEFNYSLSSDSKYFKNMQESLGFKDGSGSKACEDGFDSIYSMMKQLVKAISSSSTDLRDKLYINEYVMDKFTFLTSQTERDHLFKKGEVEYILNGMDIPYDRNRNCQAIVVANVIAEVWFLRFSIDSVDAFATSKIAHPLARLAWALAEGALEASREMLAMLKGEGVKLCPSLKGGPELRYSDHLRILLLMQDEDETLRKIQQLIQVDLKNTGKDRFKLRNCNTAVNAETEVYINLFFLPVLNLDGLGFRQFDNNSYIIRRKVIISY